MNPSRAFLVAGLLSLALVVGAFAAAPPAPQPAVARADVMVTINFSGVTLHAIVQYLSEFTGKPVLLPDKFPGDHKIDIVSSQTAPVPIKKAAEILSTALRSAGYVMIETPYQIQIVAEAGAEGAPVVQDQTGGAIAGQTLVTITKELKKADAAKMQPILQALKSKAGNVQLYPDSNTLIITEYGPQLTTMLTLLDKLDKGWEGNRPEVVSLQKSSVDSLRSVVDAFVKNMALNAEPAAKKRLDSFSIIVQQPINSFVLFGYPEDVERVKEFIRMIDVLPAETSRTFHTYRVLNRDVAEMVTTLQSVFNAVKARGGAAAAEQCPTVIADLTNSSLIVIASPDRYAEYLPLFLDVDKPKDQVQIESAIVELSTDRLADLGVELATADVPSATSGVIGAVGTSFGLTTIAADGVTRVPVAPPNGGLTAAIFKNLNVAAIARLSLQDQNVAFIAGPLVTTNDNCKATVDISEERQTQQSIISPEGQTSGVTAGPPATASISLEITPHINDEGTVRMEIVSLTEQFLATTITTDGVPLYNKSSRKATTQVTVPNGSTIVIGGLTSTTQTKTIQKVPFLGDIPLLGWFFSHWQTETQRESLCIFITPRVIRSKASMALAVQEKKDQLRKMNESIPTLQNDSVNEYVTPEPGVAPTPALPPRPEALPKP
jgi:general secretion pathway protein D